MAAGPILCLMLVSIIDRRKDRPKKGTDLDIRGVIYPMRPPLARLVNGRIFPVIVDSRVWRIRLVTRLFLFEAGFDLEISIAATRLGCPAL